MTEQAEVLSADDARARVAVLEAELADLRKRVCVPEGYVVVPVEPTIDMSAAARRESHVFITFGEAEQVYRSMIDAAPACSGQTYPLYITHRPLIHNAINLLGMRRPVAPDVELVINGLRAMLDGMPTPAEPAAEHWIAVAQSAAPAPVERATDKESLSVDQLWAVHAQGPDELYPAFNRDDAEKHAAALNALSANCDIKVSAVVVESPWPAAEHWKYLAEQEREHSEQIAAPASGLSRTIIEALEFYASGSHFMPSDKDEWDTVSGEPQNWLYGENADAGVEDGQVAMAALAAYKRNAAPAPAERNQCDGCQAGIPVENGMHHMGKPGGYVDLMACTADRYGSAPVERVETDKRIDMWGRIHDLAVSKGYDHVLYAVECAPVYKCDCMGARKVALDLDGNTMPCECVTAANDTTPQPSPSSAAQDVEGLLALADAVTPQIIDWVRCGLSTNGHLTDGSHPALNKLREAYCALAHQSGGAK